MIWFISDLHFYHGNVIKYNNRPFANVEEMNKTLIENWNAKVAEEDSVYHLGDFSFGNITNTIEIMNTLKGNIFFIQGNHDQTLMDIFFKHKIDNPRFKFLGNYYKLKTGDERIILCHYPIENWDGKYRDWIHLHGHNHFDFGNTLANRFDMSVDGINFQPMSLTRILEQRTENAYKRIRK